MITNDARIAIILLNYNNYEDTITCLESLKDIDYFNYHIYVVDNHSTNDSVSILKKYENSRMELIQSDVNGGFAYGNNIAIKKAIEKNYDYVLLLNNDTIVTSDFLNILVKEFDDDNVGISTCRIMYSTDRNKVWYAGGKVDWDNIRAEHCGLNEKYDEDKCIDSISFASGCCMLISRKCIEKVGMLPEDYFMYYEDLDYCISVIEKGYCIKYNPQSVIYHCVSSSSGGEQSTFVTEWSNRSRRKFYAKYKYLLPVGKRTLSFLKCELRTIIKILVSSGRKEHLKAYINSFKNK